MKFFSSSLLKKWRATSKQQPPPAEPRPVVDPHGGDRPGDRVLDLRRAEHPRRQQLQQGLRAVEHPGRVLARDDDALRRNFQDVFFGLQRLGGAMCHDANGEGLLGRLA